jgi:2-methylcitrate dehydratase PrpD
MDCALRIKQKHSPHPDQIKEVICRTAEGPVHRLWEPLANKQKPVSSYGAKFSLPYSIAVMLIRGRAGLEEFSESAIRDHELLDLAAKVRYEVDPKIDYPRHFEGHVQLKMKDGSVFTEDQLHPRGGYEDPLPPEEIEAKFHANARLALAEHDVEEIIRLVQQLETLPSISRLTEKFIP